MENQVQWVLRNRMQHFGEPESAKALCGVKLWTAQVVVVAAEESRAACWPYCTRCVANLKKTAQKLVLEIVSYYYLAQGKNWTEEQVAQFERYQDTHLWLTKAIQQAEPTYQPLDWAGQIAQYKQTQAAKANTAKRQYAFDGGIGWYIVEGLDSFGTTAEDFTGPYATHQEALNKLATYRGRGNDTRQIYWIGADGFAYVDQEGASGCGRQVGND